MDFHWDWEEMCGPEGLHPWNPKTRDMGYCFQRLFILIPSLFLIAIVSSFYVGRRINWVTRGKFQERAIILRSVIVFCLALIPLIKIYKIFNQQSINSGAIDYFTCSTECIAWFIHFCYILALRHRLGVSPRGSILLLMLWSITAVLSVISLRTLILMQQSYALAVIILVLHIGYAITLLPSEGVTSRTYFSPFLVGSQYSQLSEQHPILQDFIENNGLLGTAMSGTSVLSKLFFYWVDPLFRKGIENKLKDPDDLFDLPQNLSCSIICCKMEKALIGNVDQFIDTNMSRNRRNYGTIGDRSDNDAIPRVEIVSGNKYNISLFKALHCCFGVEFYAIGILKLLADVSGFAGPLLLNKLVLFIEDPTIDMKMGYVYVSVLLVSSLIGAFCDSHFNMYMAIVSLKLRAAILSTVFRKTLSVTSTKLNSKFTIGEMTNFISTDTDRIVNSCPSFHSLWSIPFQLGVTLYLLYAQVGISFLAGVAFSIILIPINRYVANKIGSLSTDLMIHKDGRVGLMTEIIKFIRTIKLYVWEDYFADKVETVRCNEMKYLKKRKYLDAVCVFFWATTPVIVTALTLTTYVLLGNTLTAATVFTTIALLNMLIAPLNAFPWVLNGLTEAWVSIKRVQRILDLDDLDEDIFYKSNTNNHENNIILSLNKVDLSWSQFKDNVSNQKSPRRSKGKKSTSKYVNLQRRDSSVETGMSDQSESSANRPFTLNNISININRGDLIGIIGTVGSGKSSLLNGILAEMIKVDGEIFTHENHSGFGYVSQKPWLQQSSIKDNILFGKAYEDTKFRAVLEACCLTEDLAFIGVDTCVGEGGNTLSGGQIARIALARAVYQDKQIYLLDDILSAVDIKVGMHIYKKCIMGILKYKTRILVTHNTHYLTQANKVILLENGCIKEQGPPNVVLSDIDDCLDCLSDSNSVINFEKSESEMQTVPLMLVSNERSINGAHIEETGATGSLDSWVIFMYWKSIGSALAIAIFVSLFLMQLSRNTTDLWLSYWVTSISQNNTATNISYFENGNHTDYGVIFYLSIYAGFAIMNSIFTLIRAFMFAYGGVQGAISIHKSLLNIVMKGKMKFFDLTPTGRLINRFSSDTYTVDDSLPFILNILLAQTFGLFGSLILTVYGLPWICLVVVPILPIYHWLQHRYRKTSRELKRLSSKTLSPIYSYFNDTLDGLTTIRAFCRNSQWHQNGEHYIERSQKANLCSTVAAQWLGLRLRLIGTAVLTGAAVVAVAQRNFNMVDPGLVGLSISYALSVTSLLSGLINAFTETEREMIAVERIGEYINQIETEDDKSLETEEIAPPYGWPSMGIISFKDVVMKYRPHLSPSLNFVSFETCPGEKIGVVGRTGAGKSSLFAALFRLSELHSGTITIDSVDIKNLPLVTLRSRLAIIPQDPFIFNGSIRDNLDPFEQYSDVELWSALEKCGAKSAIRQKGGLRATASDLSRGHMQLMCLTRAVLQNSKILCIDEATANIDYETDRMIQETIRCSFRKSTVITIAHRISTVLDSDRIIVMGDGEILEFDTPENLMENVNSHFNKLVNQETFL